MSAEESKSSDSDYVHMGEGAGVRPGSTVMLPDGLDDPNLSQEEKDRRLAVALQQQENATAMDAHKKKQQALKKATVHRTGRSGVVSALSAVRDKDHGMLSVPAEYTTDNAYKREESDYKAPEGDINVSSLKGALPQEVDDYRAAAQLQKFEQAAAGTVQTMSKIIIESKKSEDAHDTRTARSGKQAFNKGSDKV